MTYFENGKLKNREIELALHDAADEVADGELFFVHEMLIEIISSLEEWYESDFAK